MMEEFQSLVFRCPGEHFAHDGATYKYAPVKSQEELDAKIADGWHPSLVEAVAAFKAPKVSKVDAPVDVKSPPTREELEQKAKELGIKFDGRTKDASLLKLISEKV